MKKFLRITLMLFLLVFCVACESGNGESAEDVNAKAKEYLEQLAITPAANETTSTITQDVTLGSITAEGVTVTWASNNEDVIKVEGFTGKVTQASVDTKVKLTVTLKYKSAELNKPFTVTVLAAKPKTISVTGIAVQGASNELEEESEMQLTATVTPTNATNKKVTWASSDESVAAVDKSGKVTAYAEGTATITATAQDESGIVGSFALTVYKKVDLVTILAALSYEGTEDIKIRASVVGKYAQGYMLYDETEYILYYLGKGAELTYEVGDYIEVIGIPTVYNERAQFTNTAKSEKISSGTENTPTATVLSGENFATYYDTAKFGEFVQVNMKVDSASGSYVNASIEGLDGFGVCITYPMDMSAYAVGTVYQVTGYVLYTKEYNNVKSVYIMQSTAGVLHKVTFDTGDENLKVADIEFTSFYDVELPEVYREGFLFVSWKENDEEVTELSENKDYNLVAEWFERAYEAVSYETNGGDLVYPLTFYFYNLNSWSNYKTSATVYKKGSTTVAWASQYWYQIMLKEVAGMPGFYKVSAQISDGVDITPYLDGTTPGYDYDLIISANRSNTVSFDAFYEIYNDENLYNYYFVFDITEETKSEDEIRMIYDTERVKLDPTNFKYEEDEKLLDCNMSYYDFVGWYDNPEFTGEPYEFHKSGVAKYYAKFEASSYVLEYDLTDGVTSFNFTNMYTILSEDIALPTAAEITKEGFTFLGWYENASGVGTAYTKIAQGSHGDKKLYAVWESNLSATKELGEEDIAALNQITATKFVFPDATLAKYTFTGTGLDNKYTGTINSTQVFSTVQNAVASAIEGDVIYVFGATYAEDVTIEVANVTIVGPNYNINGKATRNNEAALTGQIKVLANNTTFNGVKFTSPNGNVLVKASNLTVAYCFVNGIAKSHSSINRLAILVGEGNISNVLLDNNYILSDGPSGLSTEPFRFAGIENLTITNNVIENTADATGYAGTEEMMNYTVTGKLIIDHNEFRLHSELAFYRSSYYAESAYDFEFTNNKVYDKTGGNIGGYLWIARVPEGHYVKISGNEFHMATSVSIRVDSSKANIEVSNNAFYGSAYNTQIEAGSSTPTYSNNWFEKGVSADDKTGAAESQQAESAEAALAGEKKPE